VTEGNKAIASESLEPPFWQEPHSPTVSWEVRVRTGVDPVTGRGKEITMGVARRRAKQAEIWKAFTPVQASAAERLGYDYEAKQEGRGIKCASLEARVSGNPVSEMSDKAAMAIKRYDQWCAECKRRGIVNTVALAVVGGGWSVRDCMRQYQRGHEFIRSNLFDGVNLYAKMFGW
jgi:hypothetical protein